MRITKAESFAGKSPAETKNAKAIACNTWLYSRADGATCIRLHKTDIVAHKKGCTEFNSGGWRSVTTKDRMGYVGKIPGAPTTLRIFSQGGAWYVRDFESDKSVPYFDGFVYPRDFNNDSRAKRNEAKEDKTLKAIAGYIKKVQALDKFPLPDGGDCFMCAMFDANMKPGGNSTDAGHLRSHIKEGYIHGSLLVNAMRWAGYRDTGIGYHLQRAPGERNNSVVRALRRYLKRQLGLG